MPISKDNVFVANETLPIEVNQKSLGHFMIEKLTKTPDKLVYIDYESGREWIASELKETILTVASCLTQEFGMKQGAVVCISYDCSDWSIILAISIICAGGTVCSHYPKDPYAELLYLAKKVEFEFIFCNATNLHWAKKLQDDMGFQVTGFAMDDEDASHKYSLKHLLSYQRNGELKVPVACKNLREDIAIVMMSSGTTGRPKAIPYTHYNIIADYPLQLRDPNVRLICSAPIGYVSGRLMAMNAIMFPGVSTVIVNGPEPELFFKAVERYHLQAAVLGAGSLCNLIAYDKTHPQYNIDSLVMLVVTGVKIIFKEELERFYKRHPHIRLIVPTYGTSEVSSITNKYTVAEQCLNEPKNCGRLKFNMKARIVDTITGKNLGPNQLGAIHLTGDTVFPGYMDKERTKGAKGQSPIIKDPTVFDEFGFYITGDIGYFSENQDLYVEGREKELLCCRGPKKVLPQELDDILCEHPAVMMACVIGIKQRDNPVIDCPRAFIELKPEYYKNMALNLSERLDPTELTGVETKRKVLGYEGRHTLCSLPEERRRQISEDIMMFMDERVSWKKQLTGGLVILDSLKLLRNGGKIDKMYLRSLTLDDVEIYGDISQS